MHQNALSFSCGNLQLEGVLGRPDDGPARLPGVVICHPHPLHGGNMNNNLVLAVYTALVEQGYAAFRFNFRGVGNSQGTHTAGDEEPQDAMAALNAIKEQPGIDGDRLGLAGYSFGTGVILSSLAAYTDPKAFVLLSAPIRYLETSGVMEDTRPKLFVCGDRDHVAPKEELESKVAGLGPPAECRIVAGADHFWAGLEMEGARHAVEFFKRTLG